MLKQKVYSVADVAIGMNVCKETVRRWLKSGRLGGRRLIQDYIITAGELRSFLGDAVYKAMIDLEKE